MGRKVARKVHKKKPYKIIIAVILFVLLFLAGFALFLNFYRVTTISDNIYVNSVHLGGLTVDEAVSTLNKEVGTSAFEKAVKIKYADKEFEVELLGLVELDAEKTAKNALLRSNNLLQRLFKSDKVVIPYELNEKDEELCEKLYDFARYCKYEEKIFTFNEDYTQADVNADIVTEIMSVEKTAEKIASNAKNNIFNDIDAVLIKKNDNDFREELYKRLDRPAKNASIGMNTDKSTYIIPEEMGVKANEDVFEDLYEKHSGVFSMDIQPIEPDVRTSELDIEFYQDVLGSYTSAYNMGLVNRTKNVALAARLVNGTVIMPGKRFSYNNVVGKRTYERGFVDATVYTGEGTEEGVGGGICQVSSTIYCAQLRADLKTVSRTNHSYTIVYVPLGQDATVVYGALDYVFENTTSYPIKVVATASGGYLTVKIMGTKIDKSTKVDVVSITNSTIPKGEVQKETDTLPLGQTKVEQAGQNGAVASTYKVYYKDGVEQRREFIGKSHYKPLNKIILVGTAVAEEEEKPEQTEKLPGENTEPLPEGTEQNPDDTVEKPETDTEDMPVTNTETVPPADIPAEPDKHVDAEVNEPITSDTGL